MSNILDLISTDFRTFAQRPFNATDSLVFCELAYLRMPKSVSNYNSSSKGISTVPITDLLRAEEYSNMFSCGSPKVDEFRLNLLMAVVANPRYRGLRIGESLERFDDTLEQQFAAVTFDLSDCEGIDSSFPMEPIVASDFANSLVKNWFNANYSSESKDDLKKHDSPQNNLSKNDLIKNNLIKNNYADLYKDYADLYKSSADLYKDSSVNESESRNTSDNNPGANADSNAESNASDISGDDSSNSYNDNSDNNSVNSGENPGFFTKIAHKLGCALSKIFSFKLFKKSKSKEAYSGALVVAFRGTDNTLVGWKEDFNMAFRCPIPAQESAEEYLLSIAKRSSKKRYNLHKAVPRIIVAGHSKGGNMAVYAAMKLNSGNLNSCKLKPGKMKLDKLSSGKLDSGNKNKNSADKNSSNSNSANNILCDRLERVYSMDGPGFASDVINIDIFSDLVPKIEKIVPSSAFIGLLMPEGLPYKVTEADSIGLMQHFGMYWQVKNGDFSYCNSVTKRSLAVSKVVNRWMSGFDFDERQRRIESVYNALSSLGYPTFDEISSHWSEMLPKLWYMTSHIDDKSRSLLIDVLAAIAGFGK